MRCDAIKFPMQTERWEWETSWWVKLAKRVACAMPLRLLPMRSYCYVNALAMLMLKLAGLVVPFGEYVLLQPCKNPVKNHPLHHTSCIYILAAVYMVGVKSIHLFTLLPRGLWFQGMRLIMQFELLHALRSNVCTNSMIFLRLWGQWRRHIKISLQPASAFRSNLVRQLLYHSGWTNPVAFTFSSPFQF